MFIFLFKKNLHLLQLGLYYGVLIFALLIFNSLTVKNVQ